MEVVCQANEIRVQVNGELVNHATNVSETSGANRAAIGRHPDPVPQRSLDTAEAVVRHCSQRPAA